MTREEYRSLKPGDQIVFKDISEMIHEPGGVDGMKYISNGVATVESVEFDRFFITQDSEDQYKGLTHGYYYTAGMVASVYAPAEPASEEELAAFLAG